MTVNDAGKLSAGGNGVAGAVAGTCHIGGAATVKGVAVLELEGCVTAGTYVSDNRLNVLDLESMMKLLTLGVFTSGTVRNVCTGGSGKIVAESLAVGNGTALSHTGLGIGTGCV